MRLHSSRPVRLTLAAVAAAGLLGCVILGLAGVISASTALLAGLYVLGAAGFAVLYLDLHRQEARLTGVAKRTRRQAKVLKDLKAADARRAKLEYRQVEALAGLYGLLSPRAPMPGLRGWAASPDVVHKLVELVWQRRPKLIVECGSGASSVWLGYAVEKLGEGRVVSLEHDERYAQTTRDLVRAHGLEGLVEIRDAPLVPHQIGAETYNWYDPAAYDDLRGIGLLFVDGPPGWQAHQARYPAMPLLGERLEQRAVIVVDDAARPDERAIGERWVTEFPPLTRTSLGHEHGTDIFTRE